MSSVNFNRGFPVQPFQIVNRAGNSTIPLANELDFHPFAATATVTFAATATATTTRTGSATATVAFTSSASGTQIYQGGVTTPAINEVIGGNTVTVGTSILRSSVVW